MKKYIVLHKREGYSPVIVYIDCIAFIDVWDSDTVVGINGGATLMVVETIGDILLKIKKVEGSDNGKD